MRSPGNDTHKRWLPSGKIDFSLVQCYWSIRTCDRVQFIHFQRGRQKHTQIWRKKVGWLHTYTEKIRNKSPMGSHIKIVRNLSETHFGAR